MEAVDLAVETIKQFVTLSSAIVTLSFTFLKNFYSDVGRQRTSLNLALSAHFFSIVCGVWALMAVTGVVATTTGSSIDIYQASITLPTILQILGFLFGLLMMLVTFIRT